MGLKSHDVRRMRACSECGKLGILDAEAGDDVPALVRIGSGRAQRTAHPRCIDVSLLMVLSRKELDHVRLCDVDAKTMKCLLSNLKHRIEYGTNTGRP